MEWRKAQVAEHDPDLNNEGFESSNSGETLESLFFPEESHPLQDVASVFDP